MHGSATTHTHTLLSKYLLKGTILMHIQPQTVFTWLAVERNELKSHIQDS